MIMSKRNLVQQYPKLFSIIERYYDEDTCPTKQLDQLIKDSLGNIEQYNKKWIDGVLKDLSLEVGFEAESLTFGYIPNYGGMFEQREKMGDGEVAVTQIQFYVSLLDNVYTVQVLELVENRVLNPFLKREVAQQTLNRLWVSPDHLQTRDLFKKVEAFLETAFGKPIFLPYRIRRTNLIGYKMPHTSNENNKIGNAFFQQVLPLNHDYRIMGNQEYRITDLN